MNILTSATSSKYLGWNKPAVQIVAAEPSDSDTVVGHADVLALSGDNVVLLVADGLGFVLGEPIGVGFELAKGVLKLR